MPRILVQFLVFSLILAGPVAYARATGSDAEPPFRYYSTIDGLTQSEVTDIAQDDAGYLWLTTRRGLNRYDGIEFEHFTVEDGLPANEMTALMIHDDNSVWVGDARGGISVIRDSGVNAVIQSEIMAGSPVADIVSVRGRIFVISEDNGVAEVQNNADGLVLRYLSGAIRSPDSIAVLDDNLWIASAAGLHRIGIEHPGQPHLVDPDIRLVHADSNGMLWVADADNRIGVWRSNQFDLYGSVASDVELVSLTTKADGSVWAATRSELFKIAADDALLESQGATGKRYTGISEVTSIFFDSENTLWLLSESRLIRFLGERFQHFNLSNDGEYQTMWSMTEDHNGRMWFGTQTDLLVSDTDGSLTAIGVDHGVPNGPVRDLVTGDDGVLWIGIRDEGLVRMQPDSMQGELIARTAGLEILDVALTPNGLVWFSTFASGVYSYSPTTGELRNYAAPNGASVYTIDTWNDNSVWFAADRTGVVNLIADNDGIYQQRRVLDAGGELSNLRFNHLRITGDSEFWLAAEEGGLYRYEDDVFSNPGLGSPWGDQTIYLVESLPNGTVVVGGELGLYQFRTKSESVTHYNQLSGFLGVETNVHASYFDSDQRLWIGTVHGATRMNTMLPAPEAKELTPQIIRMATNLDDIHVAEGDSVDPQQLGVHVDFAAVSTVHPRSIEYSYRLMGLDTEWHYLGSTHTVSFSHPPPGAYRFAVRARHTGGTWGTHYASRAFDIRPYFWQTTWFSIAVAMTIIAAFFFLIRIRTRLIALQNDRLRIEVDERTRSIQRAKEELLASNSELSNEIQQRERSEKARIDVETRFRRAFEYAPIGMGLLDKDGYLFDVNPVLRNMLWPDSEAPVKIRFAELFEGDDHAEVDKIQRKLQSAQNDNCEARLTYRLNDTDELRILVSLSTVRSDDNEIQYYVLQLQDITESKILTERLEYQASYDELTGLLNRRSFERELEKTWSAYQPDTISGYLLYMDLDQFKVVNDTSGHAAGDQLLKSVADSLRSIVRTDDAVCRLGGDEFAIILHSCPRDVAARLAEAIRQRIDRLRFQWGSEIYRIGISIGGIPIQPDSGTVSELQQLADAACYAAKEAGRNRVHLVDGEKDTALERRGQVRWVQRLREAMDNDRFVMYGQTIKPLQDDAQEPERIEVLLRLRDPETRKLIPPGAFLPAAERYGLITELDEWVVQNLLDMLYVHQATATEYRRYWVNLSGTSVGDKRFAAFLIDAIQNSPLPAGTINFEITETAVIRSLIEAGKLMHKLRHMGCQFALDDFGSGLSSFGHLKKLPVDYLKIDGMFIREILNDQTNQIFVKSIIDIAHTLNIKTIAEFVENGEMLELMKKLGADYAQGFGVSRPSILTPNFAIVTDSGDIAQRFGDAAS